LLVAGHDNSPFEGARGMFYCFIIEVLKNRSLSLLPTHPFPIAIGTLPRLPSTAKDLPTAQRVAASAEQGREGNSKPRTKTWNLEPGIRN